jgi:hypothetical protein
VLRSDLLAAVGATIEVGAILAFNWVGFIVAFLDKGPTAHALLVLREEAISTGDGLVSAITGKGVGRARLTSILFIFSLFVAVTLARVDLGR